MNFNKRLSLPRDFLWIDDYKLNLITFPTCFTKTDKSTIDLFLTNKEDCLKKTKVTEIGLIDCHGPINTINTAN